MLLPDNSVHCCNSPIRDEDHAVATVKIQSALLDFAWYSVAYTDYLMGLSTFSKVAEH